MRGRAAPGHPGTNMAPPTISTGPLSSSISPRWQQLIQDPSELDIKSYSCGQETDLNAGTLNIGGSIRERITDITFTFAATQMDYLCLQDTRQTKREELIIANLIRELLPPGSLVLQAPIVKTKPSPPPNWWSNDNHQPSLEPLREPMVHGPHATRTPNRHHDL